MELERLGWGDFFIDGFRQYRDQGMLPARVVSQQKGLYLVQSEEGMLKGQLAGKFRYQNTSQSRFPAVGDWVVFRRIPDSDQAVIHAVLTRKNYFARKMPISGGRKIRKGIITGGSTEEQVLAANIDYVLIVSGLDDNFNLRRIERYLTLVCHCGAEPVILLNKADLCDCVEERIAGVRAIAPDAAVHRVSVTERIGLDVLDRYMGCGKTLILIGSSGVGKSTLSNYLLGAEVQKTSHVSEVTGKGRHTTTHRELLIHPTGGMIIDTPGIRELQLWGDAEEVERNFNDITRIAAQCKYSDCRHETEPGCAIRRALEDGSLSEERYMSFMKQCAEIEHLDERKKQFEKGLSKKERLRMKIKYQK